MSPHELPRAVIVRRSSPRSEPAEPDLPVVAGVVRADQVTWVVPAEASVEHPAPPPPPSARRRSVEDAAVRTPEDLDGEAGHLDLSRSMPLPAPAMSGAARPAPGPHPTSPHASGHADTVYGLLPDPARAQVSAVFCPNGHPSPHGSPVCRDCAVRIVDPTPHLLPRPRLGTLRFSSGQTVSLDRSVLIGRNPMAMRVSGDEFPTIIPLRHAGQDVSRTHVEIRLVEWSVLLIDLGSRNGTMVTIPGRTRLRLEAHRPIELIPGTVVQLADDVTFVFEVQR
ncbi:MAG: FHA domain-containing protein [Kineosporiaceae bacterium]